MPRLSKTARVGRNFGRDAGFPLRWFGQGACLFALYVQEGWYCQFFEEDTKTPLPRTLTFADARKIWEIGETRRLHVEYKLGGARN